MFKTMQNLEKAFHCLRQILMDRNIEVKSKASVLSESGLYIKKLEQQIRLISYQNQWIKQQLEYQHNIIEQNERSDSNQYENRPQKRIRLLNSKGSDQELSEKNEHDSNSDSEIDVESV